jgi:hypothetical protein
MDFFCILDFSKVIFFSLLLHQANPPALNARTFLPKGYVVFPPMAAPKSFQLAFLIDLDAVVVVLVVVVVVVVPPVVAVARDQVDRVEGGDHHSKKTPCVETALKDKLV